MIRSQDPAPITLPSLLQQMEESIIVDDASNGEEELHALVDWMAEEVDEPQGPATSLTQRPENRRENEIVFLTVAEVAAVMRISKMTVYRLVHSGHLPAIRVGRSFRVPEQAVHAYLADTYVGEATRK